MLNLPPRCRKRPPCIEPPERPRDLAEAARRVAEFLAESDPEVAAWLARLAAGDDEPARSDPDR